MPNDITESAAPNPTADNGGLLIFGDYETFDPPEDCGSFDEERDEIPYALTIDTGGEG